MTAAEAPDRALPAPSDLGVRVVGVDLSLTSTGIAYVQGGMPDGATVIKTGDLRGLERLRVIVGVVRRATEQAHLVVIEGPSYGSQGPGQHERGGLWWMVYEVLDAAGKRVAVVPPSNLKQYATGSGKANKNRVMLAVERRYPNVIDGDDTADALVLAAMGARHLGQPIEASMPAAHLKGMEKVSWP